MKQWTQAYKQFSEQIKKSSFQHQIVNNKKPYSYEHLTELRPIGESVM